MKLNILRSIATLLLMMFAAGTYASPPHDGNGGPPCFYSCAGEPGPAGPAGADGQDGADGADGADGQDGAPGASGPTGVAGLNGGSNANYNLETYDYGIASAAAIANIPALSHVDDEHGHTGVGVGFGTFNNADVLALGIMHQQGAMSFKGTVSKSLDMFGNTGGDHAVFGAGASYQF